MDEALQFRPATLPIKSILSQHNFPTGTTHYWTHYQEQTFFLITHTHTKLIPLLIHRGQKSSLCNVRARGGLRTIIPGVDKHCPIIKSTEEPLVHKLDAGHSPRDPNQRQRITCGRAAPAAAERKYHHPAKQKTTV